MSNEKIITALDTVTKLDDFCTKVMVSYSAKMTGLVKLDLKHRYLNEPAWDVINQSVIDLEKLKTELQELREEIVDNIKGMK